MSETNPNDYQVGGSHYKNGQCEAWDFIEINSLGFLEGSAIKYVARNRRKHASPVEDLNKAIHYCQKLQSLHLAGLRKNRANVQSYMSVGLFAQANGLTSPERLVVAILTYWADDGDIQCAIEVLEQMRDAALAARGEN